MILFLRRLLLAVLLIGAAQQDLACHRIPNLLTAGGACIGLLLALFSGKAFLSSALVGFFAALGLGILLWMLGAFRAGDAKLYAALGIMMGWQWVLSCFLWSMLVAGTAGAILLLYRGILLQRLRRLWEYGKSLFFTRRFIPYSPQPGSEHELPLAPSIALGGLLTVFFPLVAFP